MNAVHSTAYGWLMLAGILVSVLLWSRMARRDERLVLIYIAALTGAFVGAKPGNRSGRSCKKTATT